MNRILISIIIGICCTCSFGQDCLLNYTQVRPVKEKLNKTISYNDLYNYINRCYNDSIALGPYGSLHGRSYSEIIAKYKNYYPNIVREDLSIITGPKVEGFRAMYNSLKPTQCEICSGTKRVIYLHRQVGCRTDLKGFLEYLETRKDE